MNKTSRQRLISETLELLLLISSKEVLECLPGHVLGTLNEQLKQAMQWAKVICEKKEGE